jgi:hypothetical protein
MPVIFTKASSSVGLINFASVMKIFSDDKNDTIGEMSILSRAYNLDCIQVFQTAFNACKSLI